MLRFLLFLISITTSSLSFAAPSRQLIPFNPFDGTGIVNWDHWICGPGFFTETLAQAVVQGTCDEKSTELNMCCAVHDSCYDNQKGRSRCDERFCECLDNAMNQTDLPFSCTSLVTDAACKMVTDYGESSYSEPRPDNTKLRALHPALNKTANNAYMRLYSKCPGFRKPLTVCAYNHQVCHLKMRPITRYAQEYPDCIDELTECLSGAADFLMDDKPICLENVNRTIEAIWNDARESGMAESLWSGLEEEEEETDFENTMVETSEEMTEKTTMGSTATTKNGAYLEGILEVKIDVNSPENVTDTGRNSTESISVSWRIRGIWNDWNPF